MGERHLVKAMREFLGVPVGAIGEVISTKDPNQAPIGRCEIKFDCKKETVLIQYPYDPFCQRIADLADSNSYT